MAPAVQDIQALPLRVRGEVDIGRGTKQQGVPGEVDFSVVYREDLYPVIGTVAMYT